ncbi:unnamed protein product [Cuscuta europaea]|uniref:Cytochrome P450 n=1 Tax=Cuscuta europaea TaxID=41803 RepID=A0A9P1A0A0_CUSEU|nr:unnamed protein product [Cuscuta europaea]
MDSFNAMPSIPVGACGTTAAAILILSTTLLLCRTLFKKGSRQKLPPPEVGGAWPIIGHLRLLIVDPRPLHLVLGDLADKYGPMFQMRLGAQKVLVVSDSQIAKEIFTVKDRAFGGRPASIAMEVLGYNYAIYIFSPDLAYWRDLRKVVMVELLSTHRLNGLRHFWESGLTSLTEDIYRTWLRETIYSRASQNPGSAFARPENTEEYVKVEMIDLISRHLLDILTRMLFGQPSGEEGSKTGAKLRKFFDLLAVPMVGDAVPWLRWLDIGGHEKAMRETARELDEMVEGWLQQHKMKRQQNQSKGSEEEVKDFMDALITRFESEKDSIQSDCDTDTIVKSTCLAILAGASDTTTITLVWAISLLLNHESCLEKVKAEVDMQVGRERNVNPSDLNNLTYLHAVIKETLRLYPAGPLSLPHEAVEDCTVNGYDVSKGTRLLVNLPKMHRDPNIWKDSIEFRPERFLDEKKDTGVKGNHFELLPFGSGRRVCQGMSLAQQVVGLGMAKLVHGFHLKRVSEEAVDMTECSATLTSMKATPLHVLLSPRLPSHLYQS